MSSTIVNIKKPTGQTAVNISLTDRSCSRTTRLYFSKWFILLDLQQREDDDTHQAQNSELLFFSMRQEVAAQI